MKILYFTNKKYAWNVQGTMKSIADGVVDCGHEVFMYDKSSIKDIMIFVRKHKPDQLWLASSNLRISKEIKNKLKIPVIGFGFSDPYPVASDKTDDPCYFDETRLNNYDVYVSNHKETQLRFKDKLPTIYNPTACDFKFHKHGQQGQNRNLVTMIGTASHRWFANQQERQHITKSLRKDGFLINAYGCGWSKHKDNHGSISGTKFLEVINKSIIGLDIQESYSPLAHRMLEYGACGIPVITRNRPEVNEVFKIGKEILVYDDYGDLKEKLDYYLNHRDELNQIGINALARCKKSNNVTHRVNHLLKELKKYA